MSFCNVLSPPSAWPRCNWATHDLLIHLQSPEVVFWWVNHAVSLAQNVRSSGLEAFPRVLYKSIPKLVCVCCPSFSGFCLVVWSWSCFNSTKEIEKKHSFFQLAKKQSTGQLQNNSWYESECYSSSKTGLNWSDSRMGIGAWMTFLMNCMESQALRSHLTLTCSEDPKNSCSWGLED